MNRNEPWSTWQNQNKECAPSEDADHPGHLLSLFKIFDGRSVANYEVKLSSCIQGIR